VGTGVMGSMLTATFFGIFFTPLFYVSARKWLSRKKRQIDPLGGRDEA
jgi:multidrug efflux pump